MMFSEKYKTIVADPPWQVKKIKRDCRPNQTSNLDYPTMSLDEISKLPLAELANENCHLYLWTTHKYLPDSFDLMRGWGFRYQRTLTWHKTQGMVLFGFHHCSEFVLFGYRGKIEMYPGGESFPTVFSGSVKEHSRKPDGFLDYVERTSSGPYLEMFARRNRLGWDTWGNECLVHSEAEAGAR